MSLIPLNAHAAHDAQQRGATLVDIRDPDEHARERIVQACLLPAAQVNAAALPSGSGPIVFHCRSGQRTQIHASRLAAACAGRDAYMLDGGLSAWKAAGLPVETDAAQPLELMRQVQIAAGSLVLLGAVLGATLSPWFYALSAFVGAGLLFAGLTGFCGMARLLMHMPWNRPRAA